MKKILIALLLSSYLPLAFAFPSFDPFTNATASGGTAYANGAFLYHQTNAFGEGWSKWTTGTATLGVDCTNINLTYSGFPSNFPAPPANSSVWLPGSALLGTAGSGNGAALNFNKIIKADPANLVTNKVFTSFLMQIPNLGNLTTGAIYFGGLATNSGDQTVALPGSAFKFFLKGNAAVTNTSTTWTLGIANNSGAGSAAYDAGGHTASSVVFVVADYEFGINDNPDVANFWVNPSSALFSSATPPTPTGTISITGANRIAQAADFYLLCRSGGTLWGSMFVSDFRVGDSWSYVTGGPDVSLFPVSQTNAFGTTASFTVSAVSSAGPLNYQWQLNGVNLSDGGNIVGSVTTNLVLSNVVSTNSGTYTVIISNAAGSLPVSTTLTVLDPQIVSQPATAVNVASGSSASFKVSTTGSGPLSYQWTLNGGNLNNGPTGSGSTISGATSTNLVISSASANDAGTYAVIVKNVNGATLTSSNSVLTVSDPVIVTGPQSTAVNYGTTANFTVTAAGSAPLGYQWLYNGSPLSDGPSPSGSGATISGSLSPHLTISGVAYQDSGANISVTVNNNAHNTVISDSAALTVFDPGIISQTGNLTNTAGTTAIFSVSVAATPTPGYQWFQNGNALNDGGAISGSQSPALTITGINDTNAGSYSLTINGVNGATTNSAASTLVVYDPPNIYSAPQSRNERAGEHTALVVGATGTSLTYQWQFNGTNISGATASSLSFTNIQDANSGLYKVTVSNSLGAVYATAVLSVYDSLIHLAPTNLVVARVGDGVQALNDTSGNTLYLDQLTPNGIYLSTLQIPDSGASSLIVEGGNPDGGYESVLTVSTNQQYLNFAGYDVTRPYSGNLSTDTSAQAPRAVGAVNGLGYYTLALTNTGIYSPSRQFRGVVSTDGTFNFWTAGSAAGVKYFNPPFGPSGIPTIGASVEVRSVGIVGTNLVAVYANTTADGVYGFLGLPTATTTATQLILGSGDSTSSPNEFAASPDTNTVYLTDDRTIQNGGGIQRYDWNGSSYSLTYTLPTSATGTNGARGLAVDWSHFTGGGVTGTGAVIYATTADTTTNQLIEIVDTGSASTATVLETAGPNQLLRGVRFAPTAQPVAIATQPAGQTNFVGTTLSLSVSATGSAPFYYQWSLGGSNILGATNGTYSVTNVSAANAGTYSVVVSNDISSVISSNAIVSVFTGPPAIATTVQPRVETAGDHTAFTVSATGSQPLTYQWYYNSVAITGATTNSLPLVNIQSASNGTYLVIVSNSFGTASSSAPLTVTPGLQPLSSNNLVVVRVGDGVQPLSSFSGNTVYLDQLTTNGTYANTIMLPDTLPGALIAAGGPTDGIYESVLTLSQNSAFLNIGGFNEAQPYAGPNSGVGYGALPGGNPRAIGAIDAFGFYTLAITNAGLYSGSTIFRSAVSSDGLVNFWTTGVASAGGAVKYVSPAYASGNGIPALSGSATGTRVVGFDPNGSVAVTDVGAGFTGLNVYGGQPMTGGATSTLTINVGPSGSPNDFAISPDYNTVYIADDNAYTGSTGLGGVQRWDNNGGTWTLSYALKTGTNSTVGARGLTVDFSHFTGGGVTGTGAVLYATTAETSTNRLVRIVDTGANSTSTLLLAAAQNQMLRGVRFGPVATPVSITADPSPVTAYIGSSATFTAGVAGSPPFFYQWLFNGTNISGATNATYTISSIQAANAGGYSVVVSNQVPSTATSGSATLSLNQPPQFGSSLYLGPGNGFQLNFTGPSGVGYSIYTSTNAALSPVSTTWTKLTTGATFSGGQDSFTDPAGGTNAAQFYIITIP